MRNCVDKMNNRYAKVMIYLLVSTIPVAKIVNDCYRCAVGLNVPVYTCFLTKNFFTLLR